MKATLERIGTGSTGLAKYKVTIPCEVEPLDGIFYQPGDHLSFVLGEETIVVDKPEKTNDYDFGECVDEFIRASYHFHRLRELHPDKFRPQEEYIVEEISEFMKEYVKKNRGKGSKERLNEECADMIVAALNYLMWDGMTLRDIFGYATEKTQRAIDRFIKNGEA